jgi:hypothetical protein
LGQRSPKAIAALACGAAKEQSVAAGESASASARPPSQQLDPAAASRPATKISEPTESQPSSPSSPSPESYSPPATPSSATNSPSLHENTVAVASVRTEGVAVGRVRNGSSSTLIVGLIACNGSELRI